jgi:hypothetical protein
MKYTIVSVKLDKLHPQWPEETVYYIEDMWGKRSLGCYTSMDAARKMAEKRVKNT